MTFPVDEPEAFRDTVRAWLRTHVPDEPLPPVYEDRGLEAHRAWEKELYEAGLAGLDWPEEYGGLGAGYRIQAVFQEEYVAADAPTRLNRLGLGLVGPTIIAHGTPEQRRRWLQPILSADELWCQGFTEPEAGSDLASVRTRAERDGDAYAISGTKVWTSLATYADWMFALVRTDPEASKHGGLTFVLIPMDDPGITISPIRQLHGEPGFAEVRLEDVRAPAENVVGGEGNGWSVAMTALSFERGTGLGSHVRFSRDVEMLVELAKELGRASDPAVRDALTARFVETEVFRAYVQEVASRADETGEPGPEASVTKLYWSEMESRIFETALELLGADAERLEHPYASVPADLHRRYWHARAAKIFAGTNEVQRNLIARRLLGLPRYS